MLLAWARGPMGQWKTMFDWYAIHLCMALTSEQHTTRLFQDSRSSTIHIPKLRLVGGTDLLVQFFISGNLKQIRSRFILGKKLQDFKILFQRPLVCVCLCFI